MKRRLAVGSAITFLLMALFALSTLATTAELYFAADQNGQNRVTNVQEGDTVFIAVYDPDENIDCDVRDKFWTDIKLMDPKTGAYIVWVSYKYPRSPVEPADPPFGDANGAIYYAPEYVPYKGHSPGNSAGSLAFDYMEETGANTGLFVSHRSFQIGTRVDYASAITNTHVVDNAIHPDTGDWLAAGLDGVPYSFQGGNWGYWFGAGRGSIFTTEDPPDATPDDLGFAFAPDGLDGTDPGDVRDLADDMLIGNAEVSAILPPPWQTAIPNGDIDEDIWYVLGDFQNMDTLIGLYQDQNDPTDVAVAQMKIRDTVSTLAWDQEVYKDANTSATIIVTDPDENLNCNRVEYVPVFVIVNEGSWNPVYALEVAIADGPMGGSMSINTSPTTFCALKTYGGVVPIEGADASYNAPTYADYPMDGESIRWYNIYDSGLPVFDLGNHQPQQKGSYYMQYPVIGSTDGWGNDPVTFFDTENAAGLCRVMFFAQETGPNTGIFQLNFNSILDDLGFNSLNVRDVLAAFYIDPNDEDDFTLDVAYVEEHQHSLTNFTDANRGAKTSFWLGRDSVYLQVIDSNANVDPCCPEQVVVHVCDPHNEDDFEWLILDETSSNSPVFFTNAGMILRAVWDASGIGESVQGLIGLGGFQLWPDNWKLEAYTEDHIYARYNDVYYVTQDDLRSTFAGVGPLSTPVHSEDGMAGLGDANPLTAMPPRIDRVRVANDLSYDLMSIMDTQVYNGTSTTMYFLDRSGNRVSGYVNSDCVFLEVIDQDQDQNQSRRERIDAFWDGGQNLPFGPFGLNPFNCLYERDQTHPVNALLGDTNIFNNGSWPMIYVLNPRNGRWAAVDIMEKGIATGDFVSVICIDISNVYTCVPTLGVVPGDTILAFYEDPANGSDSAMIGIKVGIGGGGTPPGQGSTTKFSNASGAAVTSYTDADTVYVTVTDPSHASDTAILGAVKIGTHAFDLAPLTGVANGFITRAITMSELGVTAPATLTATYLDPADTTDTSSATASVVASVLSVTELYNKPNPFSTSTVFTFKGTGVPATFSVTILAPGTGQTLWSSTVTGKTEVVWDGKTSDGAVLASGVYAYVVVLTGNNGTLPAYKGTVCIDR